MIAATGKGYLNSKNFPQKQATKIMNVTVSPIECTLTTIYCNIQ